MVPKILVLCLLALAAFFSMNHQALWFDSVLITQGEYWRLLTCHLVHSSPMHLVLNLAVLASVMPFLSLRRDGRFVIVSALLIGVGLWMTLDPRYSYGGLSGVLYALAVWVLWQKRIDLPHAFVLPGVLMAMAGKIFWDLWQFPAPSLSSPDAILIPHSHAFGFAAGLIWVLYDILKSRALGKKILPRFVALALSVVTLAGPFAAAAEASEQHVSSVHSHPLSTIPWLDYRRLSFYVGAGYVFGSANEADVAKGVSDAGITLDQFALNVNRPGYHLGLAYEITDHLHLEGMYFNFGKVMVEASSSGITEDQLAAAFQNRLPGTGAGPLVGLKVNTWVRNPFHRIFFRVGSFFSRSGYDLTANTGIRREETSIVLGGGYEYFYRKGLSIRAEMNYSQLNRENVWYFGPTLVVYLDGVPREAVPVERAVEPAPANLEKPAPKAAEILRLVIYFDFDKSVVRPDQRPKILEIRNFMEKHPETIAILSGHTDSYGAGDYNVKLSDRRIRSVQDSLIVEENLPSGRIKSSHFGENVAAQGNWTKEGRQRNRRVNVCVVSEGAQAENICLGDDENLDVPMGKLRFACRSGARVIRLVALHAKTKFGGCSVMSSQDGAGWRRIGKAQNALELCTRIMTKEIENLEKSGYSCVDESVRRRRVK
jgi:OmpA-OmpF porin, OOP family